MYISSFSIENYKSYKKSEILKLMPGFNLIVGKNNAGKTSLLEALSTRFSNKPHLSIHTVPTRDYKYDRQSIITLELVFNKEKFYEIIEKHLRDSMRLPRLIGVGDVTASEDIKIINSEFKKLIDPLTFKFKKSPNEHFYYANLLGLPENSFSHSGNSNLINIGYDILKKEFTTNGSVVSSNSASSLWIKFSKVLISSIYYFEAERFKIGKMTFGDKKVLNPDASNLPEVLSYLQGSNSSKFDRYNLWVRKVFPNIYRIGVRPTGNELEIILWTLDPISERDDLAIPLSESGTGVGQVLAMLYVVLERDPQIIIIDELQSFLHPGAIRKLIDIFKENRHHQYIIATHSSNVIAATNPETITLIQQEESETKLKSINKNESSQLSEFLLDIGAKLSDVFGADNILWVEGATEEICIPLIIEKILELPLMGTNVVGIINTGDLEGRDKKRIYQIYNSLSKSNSLMPPSIGFVFDKEGKKDNEIDDLRRESKGLVHFLPRRMYENYLLNSEAISVVMNNLPGFSDTTITKETVEDWINKNKSESKYWKNGQNFNDCKEEWKKYIHAGEFLEKLFSDLSEQRVKYRKTEYSVRLSEWIIENSVEDFSELTSLFKSILDAKYNRNID